MNNTKNEMIGKKPPVSKRVSTKYKKAPGAPKRFKSAFILFSAEKHKEINRKLKEDGSSEKIKTTDVAKRVAVAWKLLSREDRDGWDSKADKDKARYEAEISCYRGPWKVPTNTKMAKDPTAPKRPMSAFLAYSNSRRAALKRENPTATNAELSKMLSKTWKEAPQLLRERYMEEATRLRKQFKLETVEWRKRSVEVEETERDKPKTNRYNVAQQEKNEINQDICSHQAALSQTNCIATRTQQQVPESVATLAMLNNPYLQHVVAPSLQDISHQINERHIKNTADAYIRELLTMQQSTKPLSSQLISSILCQQQHSHANTPQYSTRPFGSTHDPAILRRAIDLYGGADINIRRILHRVDGSTAPVGSIERTLDILRAQLQVNAETVNGLDLSYQRDVARHWFS